MKTVTQEMIKEFKIMQLKYDFMGYKVERKNDISFHHLIIPRKSSKIFELPNEGYLRWNGSLLNQETSHDYLHIIEMFDYEIFARLTSEMIDENIKGRIDIENLKHIRDLLLYFEKEHLSETNKKGKLLIKEKYIKRRIEL